MDDEFRIEMIRAIAKCSQSKKIEVLKQAERLEKEGTTSPLLRCLKSILVRQTQTDVLK